MYGGSSIRFFLSEFLMHLVLIYRDSSDDRLCLIDVRYFVNMLPLPHLIC